MATTNELLLAINNMQPDVQAALPVVPNNGNPAGAYNMPHQAQTPAPVEAPDPLAWLRGSQSARNIRAKLDGMASSQPMPPQQPAPQSMQMTAPQTIAFEPDLLPILPAPRI